MGLSVALGDMIEIRIEGVTHQGWGIGRLQGFTVFVPGTLPAETVQAQIDQVKKSFAVARLIRITESSPYRIDSVCSIYHSCGGCHLQHAAYQHQLELKRRMVRDVLARVGHISEIKVHPVLGMNYPWQYRNRVQFHVQVTNGKVEIGFYRPGTRELVPVEKCSLLPGIFNDIRLFLEKKLQSYFPADDLSGWRHFVLKISRANQEIAAAFVTYRREMAILDDLAKALMGRFPQVVSVLQNMNPQNSGAVFGPEWRLIVGKERIEDKIGKVCFSISPGSFVQVNPEQTEVLYGKVLDYAALKGVETVVDVYCGIGTISLLLALQAGKVYGIEEFKEAVKDAELNARLNGITNTEFFAGKAEVLLPKMSAAGTKPDLIVVDPPRKGCDPAVLDAIAGMKPAKVIYVSCDPATLARDLKILEEKGYRTEEVQPVDMFPQTSHTEVCCLIEKA